MENSETTVRDMVREAIDAMPQDVKYITKYFRAKMALDPEFRERWQTYHVQHERARYATDDAYKERKRQAARERKQAILADPDKKAAYNARRREQYRLKKENGVC